MDLPPAPLYNCMHPDRRTLFDDCLLRCTQPGVLNNPFEMRLHVSAYGTPARLLRKPVASLLAEQGSLRDALDAAISGV